MPAPKNLKTEAHSAKSTAAPSGIGQTLPAALAEFDALPDSAHVRLPTVALLCATSTASVWRWVKSARLPAPRKLGPNTTAWNVGELRAAFAKVAA